MAGILKLGKLLSKNLNEVDESDVLRRLGYDFVRGALEKGEEYEVVIPEIRIAIRRKPAAE